MGVGSKSDLFGQVSDRSVAWARQHAAELTGDKPGGYDLTDSTRDMVRETIASGLEQGLSTEDIVDNLVERGFSPDRARLIAETEVGNANSAGTLAGYQAAQDAGVEIYKSWMTQGDERVDEDICQANEDQGPIPVDEPFQSGHMHPLGHARCRCYMVAHVGSLDAISSDDAEKMAKGAADQPRDDHG